jgi:hypothetical protein
MDGGRCTRRNRERQRKRKSCPPNTKTCFTNNMLTRANTCTALPQRVRLLLFPCSRACRSQRPQSRAEPPPPHASQHLRASATRSLTRFGAAPTLDTNPKRKKRKKKKKKKKKKRKVSGRGGKGGEGTPPPHLSAPSSPPRPPPSPSPSTLHAAAPFQPAPPPWPLAGTQPQRSETHIEIQRPTQRESVFHMMRTFNYTS